MASLNFDDIKKLRGLISDASPRSTSLSTKTTQSGKVTQVHVPLPYNVISTKTTQSGKISEEVTLVESTRKKYYDKLIITSI